MRLTPEQYRQWDHRCITLLGMSGVGKTRLATLLRQHHWFHYSGDYRIGTRYLDEPILDNIKSKAMSVPFLRDLLRSDSIYIRNNITVDNLEPVSTFLGKLGNPAQGGLPLDEFLHRQRLHHAAELKAMGDVPSFIQKAQTIYGYQHFVNDAGGSLCELDDTKTLQTLSQHSLILYLEASPVEEDRLLQQAAAKPKPLYYREAFLHEQLPLYLQQHQLNGVEQINPDQFMAWIFPRLFHSRLPRYHDLVTRYGYTLASQQVFQIRDLQDFDELILDALAKGPKPDNH